MEHTLHKSAIFKRAPACKNTPKISNRFSHQRVDFDGRLITKKSVLERAKERTNFSWGKRKRMRAHEPQKLHVSQIILEEHLLYMRIHNNKMKMLELTVQPYCAICFAPWIPVKPKKMKCFCFSHCIVKSFSFDTHFATHL